MICWNRTDILLLCVTHRREPRHAEEIAALMHETPCELYRQEMHSSDDARRFFGEELAGGLDLGLLKSDPASLLCRIAAHNFR